MRLDIPTEKKLVHQMVIPIGWGDMDVMGHVNNTVYFRYFEIIRLAWFGAVGCLPDPDGEGPVMVNAFCNFHRQLEYPGDIVAKLFAAEPGRTSFINYLTLERVGEPGVLYASGGGKSVWVNFREQRPLPLPGWLRELVS